MCERQLKNFKSDNTPCLIHSLTIRKLSVEMMTEKLNTEVEIVRKIVTEDFKRMKVSIQMMPTNFSDEPVLNSCLNIIIF
jgi:hypothetical protein